MLTWLNIVKKFLPAKGITHHQGAEILAAGSRGTMLGTNKPCKLGSCQWFHDNYLLLFPAALSKRCPVLDTVLKRGQLPACLLTQVVIQVVVKTQPPYFRHQVTSQLKQVGVRPVENCGLGPHSRIFVMQLNGTYSAPACSRKDRHLEGNQTRDHWLAVQRFHQ